jgi:mono/diheme cytochrome c family protein/DNA uptake protein ComE-like DNA-binding protein
MSGLRKAICLSFWATVVVYGSWAQDARSAYAANCANCHGADGRGNTALGRVLKLRDLRSPEVQRLSDEELLAIIGKGTDRGRMPGFQKKLGSDAIRQLAAYVRAIETEPVPVAPTTQTIHSKADFEPGDVKSVYSIKCSHCHGADGSGDTVLGRSLKLRDMRSAEAQQFPDDELIEIIAHGTDRGRMPGFRKKLGDDMVQQLASYVRGLAGRPPVEIAKRTASSQQESKPAPSGPGQPEVQVESKSTRPTQPETQVQTQEYRQTNELHSTSAPAKPAPPAGRSFKVNSRAQLVDLNSASKETLMTLPGITDADAARIIAGRPYKSSLQFKTRAVVSAETYPRIAGRVVAKKPARKTQTDYAP